MIQIKASAHSYAQILPEIGGILSELVINGTSVIACPVHGEDFKKGFPSAFLFPFPSRIENGRYSFEGKNYQLPINEPARGHAIHGLIAHENFSVKAQSENTLDLFYKYDGGLEGYPFPFLFEIQYKFVENSLEIHYQATNTGNTSLPCAFGWHPYFTLEETIDTLQVQIPSGQVIALDEKMIATGKSETIPSRTISLNGTILDNGFYIPHENDSIQTVLQGKNQKLIIEQDKNFKYLVIYTPPNRKSIAIEPLTSNINAFNNQEDLIILKPQESCSGSIKIFLEEN